jgi:hypothetical protein
MAFRGENFVHAWANFKTSGTPEVRDSYNISSITDVGTGRSKFNFSINASNANYVFSCLGGNSSGTTTSGRCQQNDASPNVAHFSIRNRSSAGPRDDSLMNMICIAES